LHNLLTTISLVGPAETEFINKRMNDPNFDPWGMEDEEPQHHTFEVKEEIKNDERFSIGGDDDDMPDKFDDYDDGNEYPVENVSSPMKHIDHEPKLIVTELGQKKRESFDFNWNEVMIRYKQIGKGVAALMQKQSE